MIKRIIFNCLEKIWFQAASLNNQNIASYIDHESKAKILDLGCGNGIIFTQRMKGKIKHSQLYGIDFDINKLKSAKKLGIIPIKSNVEKKLPFKQDYFDIIIANQIIEHIVNTDNLIKEIYRILKPSGYIIISTENLAAWHNISALFCGWHPFSLNASTHFNIGNPLKLGNYVIHNKRDAHIKVFTLRSLVDLVKLYGFKVEETYGAGYYPFSGTLSKIFSRIDPKHTAFIGLKARKNISYE